MRKIFCIGANKTGTTSLLEFFRYHGFSCGDQAEGELVFAAAYAKKDWPSIVAFAATAEFYQDLPFSAPLTYQALDEAYPDALFILSRRSDAEEWYTSITRFHSIRFSNGQLPPTASQLKAARYRYPGFMWDANRALYPSPADDPYRKANLLAWYENHLRDAREHFAGRPNFLEIEISDPAAAKKIADFVGFRQLLPILPHANRSPA